MEEAVGDDTERAQGEDPAEGRDDRRVVVAGARGHPVRGHEPERRRRSQTEYR